MDTAKLNLIKELWVQEADKRYQAYKAGTITSRPADAVFNDAIEARAALSMISDASQILHKLLEGGHSTVAGRLAGAFRNIGKNVIADNIIGAMRDAGYRDQPVYIRKSRHVPPRYEAVRDLMPAFFSLLNDEEEPSVKAVLGHFFFVYIHPGRSKRKKEYKTVFYLFG